MRVKNGRIPDKERQRRNTVKNRTKAQMFRTEVREFVMERVKAVENGTACMFQMEFKEGWMGVCL